jgi:hypothetical protein
MEATFTLTPGGVRYRIIEMKGKKYLHLLKVNNGKKWKGRHAIYILYNVLQFEHDL